MTDTRIYRTRMAVLGYRYTGHAWRFVALDDEQPADVGPQYHSRMELLADLGDYARRAGWETG